MKIIGKKHLFEDTEKLSGILDLRDSDFAKKKKKLDDADILPVTNFLIYKHVG